MSSEKFFELSLKKPICIDGLSEDDLRALVNAIQINVVDTTFGGLVKTNGIAVEFKFGSDGSFQGVYAKMNGQNVAIVPGTSGSALQLFKGSPSAINPGPGWTVETDLTRLYLNQPPDENQWVLFYASRASVLSQ
jgi:hypothetical protein